MTNQLSKQNSNLSLVERLNQRKLALRKCLILDVSASMSIDVEPGIRRIDALKNIVKSIIGNPVTIVFSTNAKVADNKNAIPEPGGSTNMGIALNLAKSEGFSEILLLTDGEATDGEAALLVEDIKVQIMFIGSGERPEFLNQLAAKSGSFATTEDLKEPKALVNKIQLLLNSGEENVQSKRSIC